MGTQANGEPGEEPDRGDDHPLGHALSHANRLHITLENIEALADLDAVVRPNDGQRDRAGWPSEPPASPESSLTWKPLGDPLLDQGIDEKAEEPAAGPTPAGAGTVDSRPSWIVPVVRPDAVSMPFVPTVPIRAAWARPSERWLLELLALGLAAGAFVAPSAWVAGLAVACVMGGVMAFVATGHSVLSLPGRVVMRTATLLRPKSLLWVPVLAARTAIAAVVLPAAVAVVVWIRDEGVSGAIPAARAGAWADGFRVAAVLVCLMLLTSVGEGRSRRAATVQRWATELSDAGLVALTAASCAVAAVMIIAAPHRIDSFAARADGLGWLPVVARPQADRVRDDIVTTELDSLVSCLATHGDTAWQTSYTVDNELDEPDVARLVASSESTTEPPGDLVTAILAAHNQLAPWVETIEVRWAGDDVVGIDRTALSRQMPLTEAAPLRAVTSPGLEWLDAGSADRTTVLQCSAGPVL